MKVAVHPDLVYLDADGKVVCGECALELAVAVSPPPATSTDYDDPQSCTRCSRIF